MIKMRPVDVKSSTYIDCSKKANDKDPKLKLGDTVRTIKLFCKLLCSKLV